MKAGRAAVVLALAAALLLLPAGPAPAGPGDRISLVSLADWDHVTVTLDLSRFAAERVGMIRIVNASDFPIRGRIPACSTLFLPADTALSRLRPAESGDFVVGAKRTVTLTRLFRVVDADKRAPAAGAAYTLADRLDPDPNCTD
jgi:hypothetical protein